MGRTTDPNDRWLWSYEAIRAVRIERYGPLGVIRATLRVGSELPLLLLEPNQIGAARGVLEIVCNRLAAASQGVSAA
jgi:hypothetical protein